MYSYKFIRLKSHYYVRSFDIFKSINLIHLNAKSPNATIVQSALKDKLELLART